MHRPAYRTAIREAAKLMLKHDLRQLAVTSPTSSRKVLGIVTLNDIARQQNETELLQASGTPQSIN